ncbi:MAG: hypothetical protein QNK30_03440 [Bacteroidales bacterium]|nr:hypothetical protein [Bacteroidales bacterium]
MRFADPFQFLPKKNRRSIFFISGLVTLILLITLFKINQPLINTCAPFGIITFELSEDLDSSVSILASWDSTNKMHVALSLGLDFVFILFYALFLSLVCFKLSEGLYGNYATLKVANLGTFMGWLPLFAGIFAIIENFALTQLLLGKQIESFHSLSQLFGYSKLILIGITICYIIIGLVILFVIPKRADIHICNSQ